MVLLVEVLLLSRSLWDEQHDSKWNDGQQETCRDSELMNDPKRRQQPAHAQPSYHKAYRED